MMRERLRTVPARALRAVPGRDTTVCDDVAAQFTVGVDDIADLDRRGQRHATHCLSCQAEAAQHRRLRRALGGLRPATASLPASFVDDVYSLLDAEPALEPADRFLSARRVAYAGGGLAVAATAGAVSAVVLASRSRRTGLAG